MKYRSKFSLLTGLMVLLATTLSCGNDLLPICGGILYAAQGDHGTGDNLYIIDPSDASAALVGPIGTSMAAIAAGPGCTLYGTPAGKDPDAGKLISIDPATGAGTVVGNLMNGATTYASIAGLAFNGGVLYGLVADGSRSGGNDNELVRINTATAAVSPIGSHTFAGDSWEGNGISWSPTGTLYVASYDTDNILGTDSPVTGAITTINVFTQNSTTSDTVKALNFIDGVLYGIELDRAGGASLVTINTTTAVTTAVGVLPANVQAMTYAR